MKKVLWTGGWDSTFRVMELAIVKRETIQPYYILDSNRASTPFELQAMQQIREMMIRKFPYSKDAIQPLITIHISEIPPDETITGDFKTLLSISDLGSQYDWLGRYAEHNGLDDLELCIHYDDKATGFIDASVKETGEENDRYYVLGQEDMAHPGLTIFKYYHFPILRMTKVQMGEIAAEHGFDDIMELTWFCHNPRRDGSPCGMCNPCKFTRDEGLGRRVPQPGLLQRIGRYGKRLLGKLNAKIAKMLR